MASGKQLSFAFGEVAPSLQYKSDAVLYSEGLSVLKNGYVRRSGGISNRAGFKFISSTEMFNIADGYTIQEIPLAGDDQIVRIHSILDPLYGTRDVLCYAYINAAKEVVVHDTFGGNEVSPSIADPLQVSKGYLPKLSQVFHVGSEIGITFGTVSDLIRNYPVFMRRTTVFTGYFESLFSTTFTYPIVYTGYAGHKGLAPLDIPVMYFATAVDNEGVERFHGEWFGVDGGGGFVPGGHPHAQLSSSISITVTAGTAPNIRYFNIYRGGGTINNSFGLVGRLPITDPAIATMLFSDFGVPSDITAGPPINDRLWGTQSTTSGPADFKGTYELRSIRRAMIYQQRLMVAYDAEDYSTVKEGTIGVSKLGSPHMLHMPDVYNAIGAFEFNMPLPDKSPVVAMLAMERALIFTENTVTVIMGGDQGILTPTTINPQVISRIGCSKYVEPQMSGTRGYYLSSDHSRLMQILFGDDGNLEINEISIASEHLFSDDIVQMAITSSTEDTVWLLRRDGKLISITVNGQMAGYALHDTAGYIESICSSKTPYMYWPRALQIGNSTSYAEFAKSETEVVAASIIRDGVRNLEMIFPRNDESDEGFSFADSHSEFGVRLSRNTTPVFQSNEFIAANGGAETRRHYMNISGGVTWDAGEILTMSFFDTAGTGADSIAALTAATFIDVYFDFTNPEGKTFVKTIRYTVVSSAYDAGPKVHTMTGHFNDDLPVELRDAAAIGADDMYERFTRYSVPVNSVSGLTHLANKAVSVFADGEVISSPNNPEKVADTLTVSALGVLTLPDYFGYGYVGLPYEFEMQTLDLDTSDNRTLTDSNKLINAVGIGLHNTRGGHFGQSTSKGDISNMESLRVRTDEDLDVPAEVFSGYAEMPVQTSWGREGRVIIKQVDPLPITVLSVYPKGIAGD